MFKGAGRKIDWCVPRRCFDASVAAFVYQVGDAADHRHRHGLAPSICSTSWAMTVALIIDKAAAPLLRSIVDCFVVTPSTRRRERLGSAPCRRFRGRQPFVDATVHRMSRGQASTTPCTIGRGPGACRYQLS